MCKFCIQNYQSIGIQTKQNNYSAWRYSKFISFELRATLQLFGYSTVGFDAFCKVAFTNFQISIQSSKIFVIGNTIQTIDYFWRLNKLPHLCCNR